MKNGTLKKCVSLTLTALSAFVFAAPVANATEVKVYLSEGIGAGAEVYHVQRCSKMPKSVPLRCNKVNAEQFAKQCKTQPKEGEEAKVIEGQYIKVCRNEVEGKDRAGRKQVAQEKAIESCKDDISAQDFIYETQWAVYKCIDGTGNCAEGDKSPGGGGAPNENSAAGSDEYKYAQRIVLGTVVSSGKPNESDKPDGKKTVKELHPDMQGFATLYELGQLPEQEGHEKACESADYFVADGKYIANDGQERTASKGQKLPDSGSLPNGTMPLKECKTYQGGMIGDGRPIWTCTRGEVISGDGGTGLLSNFIGALYRWAASIVGIIAVLVMVISGIQISTAGDNSTAIEEAKTRIMQSIAGLVILFLSGLILYTINPTFFVR